MKREPVLITGVIGALVTFLAAFGLDLDPGIVASVSAVAAGVAAIVQKLRTEVWYTWAPRLSPVALGGAVVAGGALITSVGFDLDAGAIASVQAAVVAVASLVTRQFSEPAA